ncbi:urease accessory protein UreD [Mycobacterium hubeiense]|uniref:urease accessory protein UreD n=1 Tax=Mycobacterium hubeiense TaxID=1867256 RepID=UPI000C7ECFDF|nr:urease accessory protein UreD [Mycobacterium sp. QGD 101]
MRSDILIVACPNRPPRIECGGALAARRTEPDTVHLVSAAATPLGGDSVAVRIVVEPGARLRVRSAAGTVVLPGAATAESHARWDLEVAGDLDVDPQPTIVASHSRHLTSTSLRLTETGSVRVRERIQIGRTGERQGFWSSCLHADVDGRPLLRHRIELGAGAVADDQLDTPLACVSELRYPATTFDTEGTLLQLAAGGCLATWQGHRL